MTHILFWATVVACLLLTAAVIVTTRRALRTAGRDVTYGTAEKRPVGYTSRHRYARNGRSITYTGAAADRITAAQAFADIAAHNADLHHVGQACADLYLIPEER